MGMVLEEGERSIFVGQGKLSIYISLTKNFLVEVKAATKLFAMRPQRIGLTVASLIMFMNTTTKTMVSGSIRHVPLAKSDREPKGNGECVAKRWETYLTKNRVSNLRAIRFVTTNKEKGDYKLHMIRGD